MRLFRERGRRARVAGRSGRAYRGFPDGTPRIGKGHSWAGRASAETGDVSTGKGRRRSCGRFRGGGFHETSDGGNRRPIIVGLYLAPIAAIFFLWFLAATRARIEGRENRLVATVFLTSGLLFVTCLLAASAAWGEPRGGRRVPRHRPVYRRVHARPSRRRPLPTGRRDRLPGRLRPAVLGPLPGPARPGASSGPAWSASRSSGPESAPEPEAPPGSRRREVLRRG